MPVSLSLSLSLSLAEWLHKTFYILSFVTNARVNQYLHFFNNPFTGKTLEHFVILYLFFSHFPNQDKTCRTPSRQEFFIIIITIVMIIIINIDKPENNLNGSTCSIRENVSH